MLEDLKIARPYGGFVYLADGRTIPRLRPHRHVELELNVVASGEITYVVDGRRLRFPRRTLLWLFPDQEHQLVDLTDDARCYVAVFKPAFVRRAGVGARYAGLARRSPEAEGSVLHATLAPEAFDLARRMIDATLEDGLDPELLSREAGFGVASDFHYAHHDPAWLNAGLHWLLLHAWRLQQSAGGTVAHGVELHAAVRRAMRLLADEAGPDADDLGTLARRCGVSAAYLSRTFARQVGLPLSRYRNALRLRRFWDAYHGRTRPTMTAAAYAAGFGSYAQFYKVYAAAYGHGPRASLATAGPHLGPEDAPHDS